METEKEFLLLVSNVLHEHWEEIMLQDIDQSEAKTYQYKAIMRNNNRAQKKIAERKQKK